MSNKPRNMVKNRLTTLTNGTMSDYSTTVADPSQQRVQKNASFTANFTELGQGLINDTPRTKRSMDFKSAYRSIGRDDKNSSTLIKTKTADASK